MTKIKITKCAYRLSIEVNDIEESDFDSLCYHCHGFNRKCRRYTTIDDVMSAYEQLLNQNNNELVEIGGVELKV